MNSQDREPRAGAAAGRKGGAPRDASRRGQLRGAAYQSPVAEARKEAVSSKNTKLPLLKCGRPPTVGSALDSESDRASRIEVSY
jgi:hypothetical protein